MFFTLHIPIQLGISSNECVIFEQWGATSQFCYFNKGRAKYLDSHQKAEFNQEVLPVLLLYALQVCGLHEYCYIVILHHRYHVNSLQSFNATGRTDADINSDTCIFTNKSKIRSIFSVVWFLCRNVAWHHRKTQICFSFFFCSCGFAQWKSVRQWSIEISTVYLRRGTVWRMCVRVPLCTCRCTGASCYFIFFCPPTPAPAAAAASLPCLLGQLRVCYVCLHAFCMSNRDTCHDVCSRFTVDGSKVVVSVK